MYYPQTISVNNTKIELEWSNRLKIPAKVVSKDGHVVFVVSKTNITSMYELNHFILALFETKKVYITDCGKINIRGKRLGLGGFSTIYECVNDPSVIFKVSKSNRGLKEEIYAYTMLEKAQKKFIPEYKGCIGDECIIIGRYDTDLLSVMTTLKQDAICSIVVNIIRCLQCIHSLGFVHCDIKPGNILLDKEGNAVLGDLGLARQYTTSRRLVDKNNKRYGTLTYLSGDVHARVLPTRRSDMESLGWTIVELFGGKLPWRGLKYINTIETLKREVDVTIFDDRVASYLLLVRATGYNDEPKYNEMLKIFAKDKPS